MGSRSLSGQNVNNLNNKSAYNTIYGNLNSRNNTDNTRAGNNLQCGASTNLNSVFKRYGVYGYPN